MKVALLPACATVLSVLVAPCQAQDRDEMSGVTVTATTSNHSSNMVDIQATIKNNNGVMVENVKFQVRYSCGSDSNTFDKTIRYLAARDSIVDFPIDTCARMVGPGRPDGRILGVRIVNVD